MARALHSSSLVPDRILVVEDDPSTREALESLLTAHGYEVDTASDGMEAIEHVDHDAPSLIISDVRMPGVGGLDMVKALRERANSADVPIIMVSGMTERQRRVAALDIGADDYLPKPIDSEELLARVRVHLRHARRHQELARRAVIDPLTGLLNRAGILSVLRRARERSERSGEPLSVLAVDVDRFKQLNDHYGHNAGDHALRQIARALSDGIRLADHVGRLGGDEFIVVVPDAIAAANALADRLRAVPLARVLVSPGEEIVITLSIGAASLEPGESIEALIGRADAEMYRDKRERRRDRN